MNLRTRTLGQITIGLVFASLLVVFAHGEAARRLDSAVTYTYKAVIANLAKDGTP
jgi:hypothetical protein